MDPISDMFIRIKNAYVAGHETAQVSYSKFKHEILKTLERSGFVAGVERKGKKVRKSLEVRLGYSEGVPAIRNIRILSKPSRRLYSSSKEIGFFSRSGGTLILSTPQGVLTNKEAQKKKVGGEVIVEIS